MIFFSLLIGEALMKYSRVFKILWPDYTAFYLSWSRLVNKYQFWIVMAIAIIFMAMAENTGKWNVESKKRLPNLLSYSFHRKWQRFGVKASTRIVLSDVTNWQVLTSDHQFVENYNLYRSGWLQISTSNINVGLFQTINYLRRMTISKNTIHFCEIVVIE